MTPARYQTRIQRIARRVTLPASAVVLALLFWLMLAAAISTTGDCYARCGKSHHILSPAHGACVDYCLTPGGRP